jgi:hypothetical protein
MVHLEHNRSVPVVFDRHSPAKVVSCCGHKTVDS